MSEFRDASWDFGLEPGESFEPDGWENEPFDLTQPHVMTALGPIDPGALGFTLHGQRVLTGGSAGGATDLDMLLDDVANAASELEGYSVTGGRAIVDVGVEHTARIVDDLLFVAQRSPVHIVMSTGITGATSNRDHQMQTVIREITEGIGATGARAGVIQLSDLTGIEVVVETHLATGVPVMISFPDPRESLIAVRSIVERGLNPSRITVANIESCVETTEARELLQTGVFVLFDQWANAGRQTDQMRAGVVNSFCVAGHEQQILISGDLSRRSRRLSYRGGPGFVYFIDEVPLLLMEAGFSASAVRSVFVDNPASALSISLDL